MHISKLYTIIKRRIYKNAIVLSCPKSLIGAHCEFPSKSKLGFNRISR